MTEEQAIYRCFIVHFGESVTDDILHFGDEGSDKGTVFLCTFPGLRRHVMKEKMDVGLMVVNAAGELQITPPVANSKKQ
jgi:hypothetical protein